MFMSTHHRGSGGLWLGEAVATSGLLLVIFGTVRSGRAEDGIDITTAVPKILTTDAVRQATSS